MITISQKIAERAMRNVEAVAEIPQEAKKYRSLVRGMGGQIRNSGLIGTLAFVASRGETAADILLEHIRGSIPLAGGSLSNGVNNVQSFITDVANAPIEKYMVLTRSCLLILHWHRRMADVLIEETTEEVPV